MIMYDFDDKLLACSAKEIRLWDFYDHVEEAPELVSLVQCPIRVENMFVSKDDETKVHYFFISCQEEYIIYTGRLEMKTTGSIVADTKQFSDRIKCVEFTVDNKKIFVGSTKGRFYTIKMP